MGWPSAPSDLTPFPLSLSDGPTSARLLLPPSAQVLDNDPPDNTARQGAQVLTRQCHASCSRGSWR